MDPAIGKWCSAPRAASGSTAEDSQRRIRKAASGSGAGVRRGGALKSETSPKCSAPTPSSASPASSRRTVSTTAFEYKWPEGQPAVRSRLGLHQPGDLPARGRAHLPRPDLELRRAGGRDPEPRRLQALLCRADAGRRLARHRRQRPCVREPLRAPRRGVLPQPARQREGIRLPVPPVVLRPEGQPAGRAVQARHQGRGRRHAARTSERGPRAAQAQRRRPCTAWCSPRSRSDVEPLEQYLGAGDPQGLRGGVQGPQAARSSATTATSCRATGSSTTRT